MNKTTSIPWYQSLGRALHQKTWVKLAEICFLFIIALIIVGLAKPLVGQNPMLNQFMVWISNIVMLLIVWGGLRLRGQGWEHLGLQFTYGKWKTFLYSLLVFIAAMGGFVFGSIVMVNITGMPETANLSGYNYLEGNLGLLIVALLAVFVASSFGEEVIYRGFLITRIEELGGNTKVWTRVAVFVSAVIFGLIHYEWGAMGIVQTGFMGLALGISFLFVNRNLWILIIAHAYMDAILFIQLYLGDSMA